MNRRGFLAAAAAAAMLSAMPTPPAHPAPARRPRLGSLLPHPLRAGDTVALLSPSSPVEDSLALQLAREALEALGLRVALGAHAGARRGYLAGDDAARAADLNAAFADPAIRGIVCVRGGYGAMRLLPRLDYAAVRRDPKPVLGYSDITALLCGLAAQTGLVGFHGPVAAGSWPAFNAAQFRQLLLERALPEYANPQERGDDLLVRQNRTVTITGGRARGPLVGGNLAVLAALVGTPYLPEFDGAILFLEDVGEAPYRIDRMFATLRLAGLLDRVAGVVFGQCTDCKPGDGYGSLTLEQILDDYLRPLGIPAYRGAQIGHLREQFIVPVGGQVELDADAGRFRLLDPVFQG